MMFTTCSHFSLTSMGLQAVSQFSTPSYMLVKTGSISPMKRSFTWPALAASISPDSSFLAMIRPNSRA